MKGHQIWKKAENRCILLTKSWYALGIPYFNVLITQVAEGEDGRGIISVRQLQNKYIY